MKSLANAADCDEILSRVRAVDASAVRQWGTMTSGEMLCHLADANECALGRRIAVPVDNILQRTVVKFVALTIPIQWPHGIPTRPEFDPQRAGTKPDIFEADRARVARLVQELAGLNANATAHRHPIFGPLSKAEWKRWGYLHADHHLRQFSA